MYLTGSSSATGQENASGCEESTLAGLRFNIAASLDDLIKLVTLGRCVQDYQKTVARFSDQNANGVSIFPAVRIVIHR